METFCNIFTVDWPRLLPCFPELPESWVMRSQLRWIGDLIRFVILILLCDCNGHLFWCFYSTCWLCLFMFVLFINFKLLLAYWFFWFRIRMAVHWAVWVYTKFVYSIWQVCSYIRYICMIAYLCILIPVMGFVLILCVFHVGCNMIVRCIFSVDNLLYSWTITPSCDYSRLLYRHSMNNVNFVSFCCCSIYIYTFI